MKLGTRLYGTEPDAILAKASSAEALGFDSIWRGDHLLLPESLLTAYPHSDDGSHPFPPSSPVLDVLMLLAWIAQATTTIRLATGIFVLPMRDPVPVARAVQTLDILSGGRAILGLGVGWLEEEFDAVGKGFRGRGAVTDEAIGVLKTLWTDDRPHFEGAHFRIGGVRFEPKPVQKPHPPLVGGGESERALRRAAELCDGWYGHRPSPEEAAVTIAKLHELRERVGKADEPFDVTVRVYPDVAIDDVRRFEEAGVNRLVLEVGSFTDTGALDDVDVMKRFAERVMQVSQ